MACFSSGAQLLLSGGPTSSPVQKQELSLHQTPDGQIYVDKFGTKMTK